MVINYVGIALGVVLNIALARVWYGFLFRDIWRKLTGRTPNEKPTKSQMIVAIIFAILMSLGINVATMALGFGTAVLFALFVSMLFVVPVILGEWIWDKKSFSLVSINAGFYTVYIILTFLLFIILK